MYTLTSLLKPYFVQRENLSKANQSNQNKNLKSRYFCHFKMYSYRINFIFSPCVNPSDG